MRIAPRPFQLRVRQILGKALRLCFLEPSTFRLAAPERRYEPLYVIHLRCRSAAANLRYVRLPLSHPG